jgi:glycosyltransferase involved in cell wall biosynthesis
MGKLRRAATPVVWQVHDLPYADDPVDRELMTFLFRQFLMLADGLLFYEESAKQPFYDVFGCPRDKIVGTAPLGDYTQLHGPIKTKASARNALSFERAGKILFYPGTVRWTRNPASFIEAFLSHAGPNDLLIVSGRGTDQLRHLAVADRVVVKPGMIDHEEFRDLICASDYVVNDAPQYLGSAIIRAALGYGVPVIARRFGCTESLAEGACVPISDESGGVDDAIHVALAMEPDRHRRMCEHAIRNHQARPWSAYAAGCMRVYDEVISRRHRAGTA